ncbi:MAG: potassium channel family protein [Actinomycetota bacterium]|jgi:uncharacterized membrane protein|nr:potassium channel family protein [Actinomycetota bacterium]
MTTERLEAFSDGVFAIAITLLILEVHLPDDGGSLAHRLSQTWPDYMAYVTTFVTIGIMWANHHAIFRLIAFAGHGIVVANLFLLLAVSFLPFPAKILGEQLRHAGADQTAAMIFYNACFVVVALFFNLVWTLACRTDRFVPGSEAAVARITSRYRLGVPSYLAATLVAFWSVPVSLAIDAGLALLYIVLPGAAADADAAHGPDGA